jgi:hypothetical protein
MDGEQILSDEVTALRGGLLELTQRVCDRRPRIEDDFAMIDALQQASNSLGVAERLLTPPSGDPARRRRTYRADQYPA